MCQRCPKDAGLRFGLAIVMSASPNYPFDHHPCFSSSRVALWARIHLPVAPVCNVKCAFCTHGTGSACHSSKPGFSSRVMSVDEAMDVIKREQKIMQHLNIVAVSGPGEPLANKETLLLFRRIREAGMDVKLCLSTNGTLLEEHIPELTDLDVSSVSVSMSAINPSTAAGIYEWAILDENRQFGEKMGEAIIRRQLAGIEAASTKGLVVKVNTILIPGVNDHEIPLIADAIAGAGARLQNIVPLVPSGNMQDLRPPSMEELGRAREFAFRYIKQFTHCRQCRSDVVGIPGTDRVL